MRYFRNLAGTRTKFLLFALSVGLLFFLTSCLTLRDADLPPNGIHGKEESETEPKKTEYDFKHPETEKPTETQGKPPMEEDFMEYERTISAEALEWIGWYEDTYGEGMSEKVLLDRDAIHTLNRKMLEETPNMRDMTALPKTMSGDEVRQMIEVYNLPGDERYVNGDTLITSDMRNEVANNRNLDGIADTVKLKPAVVVGRSDLKGFPTEKTFHKPGDLHYDGIQETELISGSPAVVLHTSTDGRFGFVLSYFYSGWISLENIAYCTYEEYMLFAAPGNYVTVLAKTVECGGVRFDMGAVLPYVTEDADSYTIQIPKRRDDTGALFLEEAVISKKDAIHGSLDYTMKNYYRQAFLYLGTSYGWGGSGGGVDCSGFVCAVFRTFGLYLPRNTGEQSRHAGTILSLVNDPSGVLDTINQPAAVYRPGHVMLYLGKKDGTHYIIHAPQGGEQVCVAALSMAKLTGVSIFS